MRGRGRAGGEQRGFGLARLGPVQPGPGDAAGGAGAAAVLLCRGRVRSPPQAPRSLGNSGPEWAAGAAALPGQPGTGSARRPYRGTWMRTRFPLSRQPRRRGAFVARVEVPSVPWVIVREPARCRCGCFGLSVGGFCLVPVEFLSLLARKGCGRNLLEVAQIQATVIPEMASGLRVLVSVWGEGLSWRQSPSDTGRPGELQAELQPLLQLQGLRCQWW